MNTVDTYSSLLRGARDDRMHIRVYPVRMLLCENVSGHERFVPKGAAAAKLTNQPTIWADRGAVFAPGGRLVLDFGRELHGTLRVITGRIQNNIPARFRIRLGESAGEALDGTNNDHSMRIIDVALPSMGMHDTNCTAFRFVCIENIDGREIELREISADFIFHDFKYRGAFACSDPLLNQVWAACARTVQLCCQEYLWDGPKRDRLIWAGDMHPEVMAIAAIFGEQMIVERSLDLLRDETALPRSMNNISTYSHCWLLCHADWYRFHGNLEWLRESKEYIVGLLRQTIQVAETEAGRVQGGFVDWATVGDETTNAAGVHAMLGLALFKGAELAQALGEQELASECLAAHRGMSATRFDKPVAKSAAALRVLAGFADAAATNRDVLAVNPLSGITTFHGLNMLEARSMAGDENGCLEFLRRYLGGMLAAGSDTFWEHFDLAWLRDGARIDTIPDGAGTDIHGAYGEICFAGYRKSLCHGWASGPAAWMSRYILGVNVVAPGCRRVQIRPHLCGLDYVRGRFPTPFGEIEISTDKNGTHCSAPAEVELV